MSPQVKYCENSLGSLGSNFGSNNSFMSHFYTCHNSWAVVACAKLWHDLVMNFHVRAAHIFTRFGWWADKSFVRWFSAGSHLHYQQLECCTWLGLAKVPAHHEGMVITAQYSWLWSSHTPYFLATQLHLITNYITPGDEETCIKIWHTCAFFHVNFSMHDTNHPVQCIGLMMRMFLFQQTFVGHHGHFRLSSFWMGWNQISLTHIFLLVKKTKSLNSAFQDSFSPAYLCITLVISSNPGTHFNIKTFSRYRDYKDKTVSLKIQIPIRQHLHFETTPWMLLIHFPSGFTYHHGYH